MKRDLSNELTAFVISSGDNPNYEHCLKALENQTIKFKIDIIKDYHPMSVAFQEMLNRCVTPYYIEVDEDMVLKPNSVAIMYNGIKGSNTNVAMIGYQLHDTHFDFIIYGIKVYKYDIFRNYPYNLDSVSCEVEQLERLKNDNYIYELKENVLGEHSPYWSDELIYERYFNLMEKFKEYKYVWLESAPQKLWNILQKKPTKQNLYAFLGAYQSVVNPGKLLSGEKDFTKLRYKEFSRIESFLEQPISSTLYMTSKCNFKCKYCRRQHIGVENVPDLSLEILGNIVRLFPTIGAFCICGYGDPLLADNYLMIV